MITRPLIACSLLLFLACSTSTEPSNEGASATIDMNAFKDLLTKLEGEWEQVSPNDTVVFNEQWQRSNNNSFTGLGFVMSGRDTSWIEHLSIQWTDKGAYYGVRIPAQNEGRHIQFALTHAAEDRMTFENPQHDFPQRINYVFAGTGQWRVSVDGIEDGAQREERFEFTPRKLLN